MLTPKLAAKYSNQVSALLTAYRLLDLEILHNGPERPIIFPPSYPNIISPLMVEKVKVNDVRYRVTLTGFEKAFGTTVDYKS